MSTLTYKILKSLLPKGPAWFPDPDGDFEKYIQGQSDNYDDPIEFLGNLSNIRDPLKTPVLDDLEREFGNSKNENLTEDERRNFLNSYIFSSKGSGTINDLQDRLTEAGFLVTVYSNDPAQDPEVLIDGQFQMLAGGGNAFAGNIDAFASRIGGELIVNGDKFKTVPNFNSVAGGGNAFAGNVSFSAGTFNDLSILPIIYPTPTNPADWPLVFFIGGAATFDIDGKILTIDQVIQPKELRSEYLKILLRYKPLHTWCVSMVEFN